MDLNKLSEKSTWNLIEEIKWSLIYVRFTFNFILHINSRSSPFPTLSLSFYYCIYSKLFNLYLMFYLNRMRPFLSTLSEFFLIFFYLLVYCWLEIYNIIFFKNFPLIFDFFFLFTLFLLHKKWEKACTIWNRIKILIVYTMNNIMKYYTYRVRQRKSFRITNNNMELMIVHPGSLLKNTSNQFQVSIDIS